MATKYHKIDDGLYLRCQAQSKQTCPYGNQEHLSPKDMEEMVEKSGRPIIIKRSDYIKCVRRKEKQTVGVNFHMVPPVGNTSRTFKGNRDHRAYMDSLKNSRTYRRALKSYQAEIQTLIGNGRLPADTEKVPSWTGYKRLIAKVRSGFYIRQTANSRRLQEDQKRRDLFKDRMRQLALPVDAYMNANENVARMYEQRAVTREQNLEQIARRHHRFGRDGQESFKFLINNARKNGRTDDIHFDVDALTLGELEFVKQKLKNGEVFAHDPKTDQMIRVGADEVDSRGRQSVRIAGAGDQTFYVDYYTFASDDLNS